MDRHRAPGRLTDAGFASLQFVVAAALAMLMVVGLVQLITYQYARGAALAALERGVRAASVAGAGAGQCYSVLADTFETTLGGAVGDSLDYTCETVDGVVTARAGGMVPLWLGSGTLSFEVEASGRQESGP